MFSLEAIIHLNNKAAREARRKKKVPHVPTLEEIKNFPPFPLPHLGPFVPPGWEQTETIWFADSSGWGRDDEPALSVRQLKEALRQYAAENPGHGFGIVEAGQFQCHVAAFRPIAAGEKAA